MKIIINENQLKQIIESENKVNKFFEKYLKSEFGGNENYQEGDKVYIPSDEYYGTILTIKGDSVKLDTPIGIEVKDISELEKKPMQNVIKFGGLELKFNYNKDTTDMEWSVSNPNDVSYLRGGVSGFIDNLVDDFANITSHEYYKQINRKQSYVNMIRKGAYINAVDRKQFFNLAQKPKKYQYGDVKARLNVFDIDFEDDGTGQGLGINIHMKLIDPIDPKTGEKLTYNEVGERLLDLNVDDDFLEYIDGLFNDLASEIYDNRPTIFDPYNMYINIYPYFYTDEGKQMKYW
jgi:hypothetical protein